MVDILLSIYNGEKYLNDLFTSLLKQTYQSWRLLIRDDGSTDGSLKLAIRIALQNPEKVYLMEDSLGGLGACRSFAELMKKSNADYVFFCDQDDYWLPDKINISFAMMKVAESADTPILIHSDLKVCDSQLNIVSNSFWSYQKLSPESNSLSELLVQNSVTGCTIMINRSLLKLALPIPESAIMHDYWLALVASTFGRIEYVKIPTILYRQHINNNIGAKKVSLLKMIQGLSQLHEVQDSWLRKFAQAQALIDRYDTQLNKAQYHVIKKFVNLPFQKKSKRIRDIIKCRFWMNKIDKNVGLIITIVFKMPKSYSKQIMR